MFFSALLSIFSGMGEEGDEERKQDGGDEWEIIIALTAEKVDDIFIRDETLFPPSPYSILHTLQHLVVVA